MCRSPSCANTCTCETTSWSCVCDEADGFRFVGALFNTIDVELGVRGALRFRLDVNGASDAWTPLGTFTS